MKTIIDWQRQGRKLINSDRHHFFPEAIPREVDYILSGILGLSFTELYLNSEKIVDEEKGREISAALGKRLSGMPLQYILGEIEFFSLPFHVKPGVFIPRPETELLVEHALTKNSDRHHFSAPTILDLCTGSGNIALSIAKNTSYNIIATDISKPSLKVARENAIRLGLSDRVEFLQGDLFEPLKNGDCPFVDCPKFFNLIISNPPYITSREWESLPGEVKYYEPHEALFGGEDGLDFYKRISYDARKFIKARGHLLLEVGPARAVASILKQDGWEDIKIMKDYNNRDRIISCRFF
ncbi:MAG: peptide chain release factor N(5)-glutamine methyltransferase [Candidatus Omnitrophica bacterium]|nr:peptide chain release factor N(5)-glutamine methyltransferase [Candidatus Omnitrophota bacterium]